VMVKISPASLEQEDDDVDVRRICRKDTECRCSG